MYPTSAAVFLWRRGDEDAADSAGGTLGAHVTEQAEPRYDALTVQAIIARANVGRTTFYTHLRDKDDLLLHELERVMHQLGRPSLLLFRHVREFQPVYQALVWGRDSKLTYTPEHMDAMFGTLEQPSLEAVLDGEA